MKSHARLVPALIAAATAFLGAAPAIAVQAFMKVDGAPGPVARDGEPGWFRADSFTWGSASRPSPGNRPPRSGSGSFTFTKSHDSASTKLMQFCQNHTPVSRVKIQTGHGAGKGKQEYLVIQVRMTDCPDPDLGTLERYSMDFGNIQWKYGHQGKDKAKGRNKWNRGK